MRQYATATLCYAVSKISLIRQARLGTMKCAQLHQVTARDDMRQHATATPYYVVRKLSLTTSS
jgi:hypothetical protein